MVPRHRLLRFALPLALAAGVACPLPAVADAPAAATAPDLPDLESLRLRFEANPELKSTKSSGWKPYHRARWFAETRLAPEGVSPARLRRDAALVAQERAGRSGRSLGGWFNAGPENLSGRALAIDFHPTDPSIVYIGTASGGLWKSTDGGGTWAPRTENIPSMSVGAVCVLPWNPDVVLIGTGEGSGAAGAGAGLGPFAGGILKSTDAGATWQSTDRSYPLGTFQGFNVMQDNPTTQTILAGANDGLWRSTDEGDTWIQIEGFGNYFDVQWKPGDPNRVYTAKGADPFINGQTSNGVRVSTDDGLTFTAVGTGQPPGAQIGKTKLAVSADAPSTIYAHYTNVTTSTSLGTYVSTNDGGTWTQQNSQNITGGQGFYNLILASDPDNVNRVISAGVGLYLSDDAGVTIANQNVFLPFGSNEKPHWDNHAVCYEPGSTDILWLLTDGGPWRSTNDGDDWEFRGDGIISFQFYDICVAQTDPQFMMGGTQDNGIPGRSGPDQWFESTFIADGMVCNVNPTNASVIYAESQFGNHLKSNSGGTTWQPINTGLTGTSNWVTAVDQDPQKGNHLYTTTNVGMWRTTNGGNLWVNVAPHTARWISFSPIDGDVLWTVSNFFGVWRTTDDGNSWTQSATFPASGIETKIHADPVNIDGAFVTVGGYGTGGPHVLRTTDAGGSWSDVTGDLPDISTNTFLVDPLYPDEWYVGTDAGVWVSTNGGVNWGPAGSGLPNVTVTDLELRKSARKLVAGTYGRGAWELDLPNPTDVTLVGAENPDLMLDPPYPNPSRDQAVFRFAARAETNASLRVYDVQGRLVSALVPDAAANGVVRNVTWLTDDVPPGVYFAVLEAGADRVTRKVVVAK